MLQSLELVWTPGAWPGHRRQGEQGRWWSGTFWWVGCCQSCWRNLLQLATHNWSPAYIGSSTCYFRDERVKIGLGSTLTCEGRIMQASLLWLWASAPTLNGSINTFNTDALTQAYTETGLLGFNILDRSLKNNDSTCQVVLMTETPRRFGHPSGWVNKRSDLITPGCLLLAH